MGRGPARGGPPAGCAGDRPADSGPLRSGRPMGRGPARGGPRVGCAGDRPADGGPL